MLVGALDTLEAEAVPPAEPKGRETIDNSRATM